MKKKISLLILITMLSVNLLACGNKKESVKDDKVSSTEESSKKTDDVKKLEDNKNAEPVSSNVDAKSSTLQSPLKIGQTGIASKYATKSSDYHNTNISLTKVIRGEAAKKLVDDFNSKHTAVKFAALDSSLTEYAVAEYTMTLPMDFPSDDVSPDIDISSEINGPDGEGLVHDGVLYVTTTHNIDDKGSYGAVLKPGVPEKGYFAFVIPKGCTNYLVSFGEFDNTRAYFKGE